MSFHVVHRHSGHPPRISQGASDAGLIPMFFPDYKSVEDPQVRASYEEMWGAKRDPRRGLTVVEIMDAIHADRIRGMYIMGENPAMSDPDLNHARHALASLDHLVVQDIFMTETAWLADVVLPASAWPEKSGTVSNTDRMVQLGRRALDLPGDARLDLWIIQQIAARLGLAWRYEGEDAGVAEVYEEMRQAMHGAIAGITWERLQRNDSITYPCLDADDPGRPIVFDDRFPTADGRVKLVPADIIPAAERPDTEFPFVLITGRQLEHWHTGSMTRRARVLDAIEPMATASMAGADLATLGLQAGDVVTLRSRRGEIALHVRQDDGTPRGAVFVPFAVLGVVLGICMLAALLGIWRVSRLRKEQQGDEDPGPAAAIAHLPPRIQWRFIGALTAAAATIILMSAEPFAESLIDTGRRFGDSGPFRTAGGDDRGRCPTCGSAVAPSDLFCPSCGKTL